MKQPSGLMNETTRSERRSRASVRQFGALAMLFAALLAGCASAPRGAWTGPASLTSVRFEEWSYGNNRGYIARTPHYVIYSTIEDEAVVGRLSQLMEGAYQQYQTYFPATRADDKPMECYIFARHAEWESFTRQIAGEDAPVYLRINRGGYAIRDRFVAWFIGEGHTNSVAAHEGWHQYRAHYFRGVLPPFIEEGIATQFEYVRWENDLPTWNTAVNLARQTHIREAFDNNTLWPLDTLVRMHAGNIVGATGAKIEAFYSQNWAFAQFMRNGMDGKYRAGFQQLLADTAAGASYDPESKSLRPRLGFRPELVPKILEHYLAIDMATLEKDYLAYTRKI